MIPEIYHQSWLGRDLSVIESTDLNLIGKNGTVVSETKNTILIQSEDKTTCLGKSTIKFIIDEENSIILGRIVNQRPEDRIHKKYRI